MPQNIETDRAMVNTAINTNFDNHQTINVEDNSQINEVSFRPVISNINVLINNLVGNTYE